MSPQWFRRGRGQDDTVIFFSSDVHGSERCWMKFLNAAKMYGAGVLIMGGDLTGKAVVPVVRGPGGTYEVDFLGRHQRLDGDELEGTMKNIRFNGFYPYLCDPDEVPKLADKDHLHRVFKTVITEQATRWCAIARERLEPAGVELYVMPGNDDEFYIDGILDSDSYVVNPDLRLVRVKEFQMASCSWVPPTPWNSPRECSEEELSAKLDGLAAQLDPALATILNLHTPPYDCGGIDEAPQLRDDLSVVTSAGQQKMVPVGSTAVRKMIEKVQPVVALHGHIHESRGVAKIGRTACINPGSSYGEGTLDGCIVRLHEGAMRSNQLVRG